MMVWILAAIAVFVIVNVLFYSSFFTNYPQGVRDALKTFQFWSKTGKEAHVHPFITYIWWLFLQESPLLVLGAIGAILAVLKPAKAFALFAGLWAFGLIEGFGIIVGQFVFGGLLMTSLIRWTSSCGLKGLLM